MIRVFGCVLIFVGLVTDLQAGDLEVLVKDEKGEPVKDAVVFATLLTDESAEAGASPRPKGKSSKAPPTATIAQINKQFVPYVTAIQVGTAVSFPNHDDILHNVYSFSKAKKFQLPLYKDEPPEPVVFDKPGIVILGCNIHDWMVAYVYVLETLHFAKTDSSGKAELRALPPGGYEVQVRHPRKRKRGSSPAQRILIDIEATKRSQFVVALKPEWRPRRGQGGN